jgi:hypothetical protein
MEVSSNLPGPMPPEWQCLSPGAGLEAPAPMAGQRITYVVPVVDFDTPNQNAPLAVPNVQLQVCTTAACDPPAGPEVVIQQPDPMRPFLWAINVSAGTEIVSLRATAPGYVPSDYYVGGPMVGPPEGGNQVIGQAFFLLSLAARAGLLSQIGVPLDNTKGILAVRTLNCVRDEIGRSTRAAGVTVDMLPDGPPDPAVAWALSFARQANRDLLVTDDRGAAGFANLEPRSYSVRGRAPAPTGSPRGTEYGRTTATVRADTITIVEVRDGQGLWGQ